jgi:DNA modification methylase
MITKDKGEGLDKYINKIIEGNALSSLRCLSERSIDLIITSPPYWNQRAYGQDPKIIGNESTVADYIDNLIEIFAEGKRVLKKSGSCFIVISDKFNNGRREHTTRTKQGRETDFVKYKDKSIPDCSLCNVPSRLAIAMTDRLGFIQKNDIIWEKPNGFPNGRAALRRFSINNEHIFFFVKDESEYYFKTQYEPYESSPSKWNNKGPRFGGNKASEYGSSIYSGIPWVPNNSGRIKRAVWRINTQPLSQKFYAAYPEKLVEIAINASCPPDNGTVLDPFLGSGTTALVALKLNRKFIGIELSKQYIEISYDRLASVLDANKKMSP